MRWTPWRPLEPSLGLSEKTLGETLDGGQAFRWKRMPEGSWQGQWGHCAARLRLDSRGFLQWASPTELENEVAREMPHYWALEVDFSALAQNLPWRSDSALATAMASWRGLRLLRQPVGETLLAFLCSSTKRIAQIKQICELVARRLGEPMGDDFYALPSWEAINAAPEGDLRACKAGYRARYIKQTAQFLASRPRYLEDLAELPYSKAREKLLHLPGVGEKIADCVLLFGAGQLEAFPVDIWVLKAMARLYGLHHWKPRQVAHFGRVHFGPSAGLAQQYLFASERHHI